MLTDHQVFSAYLFPFLDIYDIINIAHTCRQFRNLCTSRNGRVILRSENVTFSKYLRMRIDPDSLRRLEVKGSVSEMDCQQRSTVRDYIRAVSLQSLMINVVDDLSFYADCFNASFGKSLIFLSLDLRQTDITHKDLHRLLFLIEVLPCLNHLQIFANSPDIHITPPIPENLKYLTINGFQLSTFPQGNNLLKLSLSDCNLSDSSVLFKMVNLPNLKFIDLSRNELWTLSKSLEHFRMPWIETIILRDNFLVDDLESVTKVIQC